ncbi:Uncharacterised protein [Escherichia coli]|nr:Uncharacterised protein [Escherichia coli]SQN98079.1 Uncharacterised protein [Escherichia coli]SQO01201.1 Uncharacterised protein [Escherichia coli]SQP13965.1 Uncharacterised protein [Escherichia coli]SQS79957.1 Uncharacterised protein [Escherichia coli]
MVVVAQKLLPSIDITACITREAEYQRSGKSCRYSVETNEEYKIKT